MEDEIFNICRTFSLDSKNRQNNLIETLPNPESIRLESVAALGQLAPAGDIRRLASPSSGLGGTPRVAELFVSEGDFVKKNQLIALFDNRPQILDDLLIVKARLETLDIKIKNQIRNQMVKPIAGEEGY